uniref:N-acetyltransferase domain-containing protein n=1 Tax=viral metagenome TaxID=1070528 RepID=A0A6C0DRD4_9ZZZZ
MPIIYKTTQRKPLKMNVSFIQPSELKGMKSDFILPKKLNNQSFIIAVKSENMVQSFVYFTVYSDFIHINYSFTGTQFRRMGLSIFLREYLIKYARNQNIRKIVSVPFDTANSMPLLKKMGFEKCEADDSFMLRL